ncbi:MAG: hypothetical protein CL672_06525 [Balneola sp.]|nr:hypothetical protein [Balneola sp.]|tara:strand:+ start:2620 stop:5097 length:2478 start_codon:yes stop_codon:yes gene_type:complete
MLDSLSSRTQHLIALGLLFIVPLILFFPSTIGGKEMQRHDITQWRAGAESIIDYREEFGEEPLWSKNMFGGMPSFVISTARQVPHLDTLIKPIFSKWHPAFEYWVMLAGMYILLILMGFRPWIAITGSIIYGLTTYFPIIIMAGHTSKFFALALAPWMLVGYWMITRSPNILRGLVLFSIAVSLEFRAGHPQITYYFLFVLLFIWLFDVLNGLKIKEQRKWIQLTLVLLVGGLVGVAGNAEKLLPLQEYAQYSIRGGSDISETTGLDKSYAFAWSQGIKESLTLLIPNAFGGSSPNYWGSKTVTSGPHYLGFLILPFIILGLIKQRDYTPFAFLSIGILALFFSWGENFLLLNNLAFNLIPFFDKFRAPETWLVITSFSASVLVAYGLEALPKFKPEKFNINKIRVPILVIAGVFCFAFLSYNSLKYTNPLEVNRIANQIAQQNQVNPSNAKVRSQATNFVQQRLVPERQNLAKADFIRFGILSVVLIGLLYAYFSAKLSYTVVLLLLFFIQTYDLLQVGLRFIPESGFTHQNPYDSAFIERQARPLDRFIQQNIYDEAGIYEYRVLPLLDNPFNNAVPSYFYPIIGGYSGAKLSLFQDVFMSNNAALFDGPLGINIDLLRLFNTKYISYSGGLNIPGIVPVYSSKQGSVYEVQDIMPKAFFVDSIRLVSGGAEAFDYLKNPSRIDFSSVALVEQADLWEDQAIERINRLSSSPLVDSTSIVRVTKYTGAELEVSIQRSSLGFLVINELYYPAGWKAFLNGEEIQIYKTNYFLRGLIIPPGDHELILDLKPDSFSQGIFISWLSISFQLIIGLWVGIMWFRTKES